MARKKTDTSKPAGKKSEKTSAKPIATEKPTLSIYGNPEESQQANDDEYESFDASFFIELFEDEGFEIFVLDEFTFVTGLDNGIKLMVEVGTDLPFVTFKFPLKPKKGLTKARILQWINDRMQEFPMLRIFWAGPGIILSTYDFAYDPEVSADFDVDHFLFQANMFWGLNMTMIEESGDGFLDLTWNPASGS